MAVNKMDLVGYSEATFLKLQEDFHSLVESLSFSLVKCVPVSALEGDNIVDRSTRMNWYSGPTLLEHLETVPVRAPSAFPSFRFPIQSVIRPDATFRGFAGQIAAGSIRQGETVVALPSKQTTRVQSIVSFDGELDEAFAPQSITLKLEDEIDLSRGEMLVSDSRLPAISNRFSASIVWLHEQPLRSGNVYLLKHTTRQVKARVTDVSYRIDINTLTREPANDLTMNGIALVQLETTAPLFFDPYVLNRATGSFILLDPLSNATVGAGMIREALGGQQVSNWQPVSAQERAARNGHRPAIFLLPNRLNIADIAERALFENGFATVTLNADQVLTPSLPSLLASVWSAGLIVLLVAEKRTPHLLDALGQVAGSSLFNLDADFDRWSHEDIAARILSRARSLRSDGSVDGSEKDSANV